MVYNKKIAGFLCVFLLMISLVGCKKNYSIVGTWTDDNATFVFNEDKTGRFSLNDSAIEMDIEEYSMDGDKLTVTVVIGVANITENEVYTYTLNKDELILKQSSGYEYILKRNK